ncbi:hypothetical protein JNUCC76_09735 [Leuconostoc sp. JNUCC 76]
MFQRSETTQSVAKQGEREREGSEVEKNFLKEVVDKAKRAW